MFDGSDDSFFRFQLRSAYIRLRVGRNGRGCIVLMPLMRIRHRPAERENNRKHREHDQLTHEERIHRAGDSEQGEVAAAILYP
ncbi:MAG: hypothetical protein KF794_07945 [Xanthobacteraceae bacterium]|nr:hypothetical protein [Xanthobacteraceae bacterium]QYK43746.1 MAG: hypothetical protein KF794_07945 [Xanthobacteraceae bacterium]HMN51932.1 hypothetical protein [Xanthobacteraceae bacterium]